MNLTAVREGGEVMERHVEDSLAIVPALCDSCSSFCDGSKGNLRLVDVGSGAGLPGIILAIARPGIGIVYYFLTHEPISMAWTVWFGVSVTFSATAFLIGVKIGR